MKASYLWLQSYMDSPLPKADDLAALLTEHVFEVEKTDAKTFSIILFVALTLPLLIGGAVATALTGVNIGELRDRARRSVE